MNLSLILTSILLSLISIRFTDLQISAASFCPSLSQGPLFDFSLVVHCRHWTKWIRVYATRCSPVYPALGGHEHLLVLVLPGADVIPDYSLLGISRVLVVQSRVLDDLVSSFTEKTEPFAHEHPDLYGATNLCALPPHHTYSS